MYFDIIQPIPENITSDDLFNKLSGCDLPPGHHLIKYEFYKFIPIGVFSINSNNIWIIININNGIDQKYAIIPTAKCNNEYWSNILNPILYYIPN